MPAPASGGAIGSEPGGGEHPVKRHGNTGAVAVSGAGQGIVPGNIRAGSLTGLSHDFIYPLYQNIFKQSLPIPMGKFIFKQF